MIKKNMLCILYCRISLLLLNKHNIFVMSHRIVGHLDGQIPLAGLNKFAHWVKDQL